MPKPSLCGDQWHATANADLFYAPQTTTFRRALSSAHDALQVRQHAKSPPRSAQGSRSLTGRDSPVGVQVPFLNSLITVVRLTCKTRAVSRIPLAFIAMPMI